VVGRTVTGTDRELERVIGQLCEQGCARVREYIRALQHAEDLPEFAGLDAGQRAALLRELQAIMQVYDDRC
jgi:hypothetical protein